VDYLKVLYNHDIRLERLRKIPPLACRLHLRAGCLCMGITLPVAYWFHKFTIFNSNFSVL
jgi:hypothetical protein